MPARLFLWKTKQINLIVEIIKIESLGAKFCIQTNVKAKQTKKFGSGRAKEFEKGR